MLYNFNDIKHIRKINIKTTKIMIVSIFIVVLLLVLLAIFTTDNNVIYHKILSIILFLLLGWEQIYLFTEIILKNKDQIKRIENLKTAKVITYIGTISKIDEKITINRFETASVITLKADKLVLSLYYSTYLGNCPLKENVKYEIDCANNFIIDYKEIS